ncbi:MULTISPECIES: CDGSH iron-sulfur domain-containing protein [Microterricola]|uniref:Iron-binding zinc finger CDGSH type n=2 Tax=Microterricola TaxID=518733 RepID=A0A1H1MA84_9MICO|nr:MULTISPECIES: CDGSH iron-sulfur domain-containing protein [Microterricola]PPL17642.1 iron-binding protein [Microterricola pindariensis]SDR83557.1 Iron-binding zinc finger CDGSH type [Microterricola viridarii]
MTHPEQPDEETLIVACPNGPLLVRGPIEIVDPEGGQSMHTSRTVALCRCGVSTIKPFCDGTHKLVDFRTAT